VATLFPILEHQAKAAAADVEEVVQHDPGDVLRGQILHSSGRRVDIPTGGETLRKMRETPNC
jgi:hypothetical protein